MQSMLTILIKTYCVGTCHSQQGLVIQISSSKQARVPNLQTIIFLLTLYNQHYNHIFYRLL